MAGGNSTEAAPSPVNVYSQVSQIEESMSPEQLMQADMAAKYFRYRRAMIILILIASILVTAGLILTIVGSLIGQILEIALGGGLLALGFILLFPSLLCYFKMKKIAYDSQNVVAGSNYNMTTRVRIVTTTEPQSNSEDHPDGNAHAQSKDDDNT